MQKNQKTLSTKTFGSVLKSWKKRLRIDSLRKKLKLLYIVYTNRETPLKGLKAQCDVKKCVTFIWNHRYIIEQSTSIRHLCLEHVGRPKLDT